ncbi:MAG TPA: hypothetical protein VEI97_16935, partial [bacterium]|nr:hypothetical protein [bacterium]
KLVSNADGYFNPGALLTRNSNGQPLNFQDQHGATAWPYKLLVDETQDPRRSRRSGLAVSNGGVSTGSYDASIGGWQLFNLGPDSDDWTGYGVLHQGQIAANEVRLRMSELEGTELRLDVALIAKYIDPRTGANARELRANRLPTDNPDEFHYRMPYGALDLESVRIAAPAGIPALVGATGVATAAVADHDYGATVGAGSFSQALPINHIPAPSGIAGATVHSLEAGFTATGSVGGGSGLPEDPVQVAFTLENTAGASGGSDGGAYFAVRIADQEDTTGAAEIGVNVFSLDETTPPRPLADQAAGHHPVVYQVFFVPFTAP